MILPTREHLQISKSDDRKRLIDEGVALAKKVDAVRELNLKQEEHLKKWKQVNIKQVQDEIHNLIQDRNAILEQILVAKKERMDALKPLTDELSKIEEERESIKGERNELFLDKERFSIQTQELLEEKKKVENEIKRLDRRKEKIERMHEEMSLLRNQARYELEQAIIERNSQSLIHQKKTFELDNEIQSYQVACQTIEIERKSIKEKEEEIIIREKDVERRLKMLQRHEK